MVKINEKNPYNRVGTTYYMEVDKPLASGDTLTILVSWSAEAIRNDFGKDYLSKVPKYKGFCCIPSHTNYQHVIPPIQDKSEKIHGFYNEYHELDKKPKKGNCEFSIEFMRHVFGEQMELGLDYIKLLYEKPTHILPVLCLVSSTRGTGKTTFLNWLKAIFGKNMTLNTNDDFRSQFNSDWANKLLIAVDEVLLDKKEDSERIKNLSTAKTFKAEAKGKDRNEIEFFGKFILCSNNELNFISIDIEEIRFWVRKLDFFTGILKDNLNILHQKLIEEIPAFLYYVINREYSTKESSRMWFSPSQLETEALRRLKFSNRSKMEKEIASYLKLIMDAANVDSICFTPTDLKMLLQNNYSKSELTSIYQILKSRWGLKPAPNALTYTKYSLYPDGSLEYRQTAGKFYEFTKKFLEENFDEMVD